MYLPSHLSWTRSSHPSTCPADWCAGPRTCACHLSGPLPPPPSPPRRAPCVGFCDISVRGLIRLRKLPRISCLYGLLGRASASSSASRNYVGRAAEKHRVSIGPNDCLLEAANSIDCPTTAKLNPINKLRNNVARLSRDLFLPAWVAHLPDFGDSGKYFSLLIQSG
jgi:hypothetical protein